MAFHHAQNLVYIILPDYPQMSLHHSHEVIVNLEPASISQVKQEVEVEGYHSLLDRPRQAQTAFVRPRK